MEKDKSIRLIIAGGREFTNYKYLKFSCDYMLSKLRHTHEITIISGGARGADSLGERYAGDNEFECIIKAADWDKHGKAAGYLRNVEMAETATHLIVFWDGKSKGTKHMIDIAKKYKIKVAVVRY